jgi:hypothetical protein
VCNIIQGHYQGLSQTSLVQSLSVIIYIHGWAGPLIQSVGGSYKSGSTQYLRLYTSSLETTNGP